MQTAAQVEELRQQAQAYAVAYLKHIKVGTGVPCYQHLFKAFVDGFINGRIK